MLFATLTWFWSSSLFSLFSLFRWWTYSRLIAWSVNILAEKVASYFFSISHSCSNLSIDYLTSKMHIYTLTFRLAFIKVMLRMSIIKSFAKLQFYFVWEHFYIGKSSCLFRWYPPRLFSHKMAFGYKFIISFLNSFQSFVSGKNLTNITIYILQLNSSVIMQFLINNFITIIKSQNE